MDQDFVNLDNLAVTIDVAVNGVIDDVDEGFKAA